MQRRFFMAVAAAVLFTGAWADIASANSTVMVKANSIWFTAAAKLAHWQALAKGGDARALAAYQEKALNDRDAWQFLAPITVRVLSRDRDKHRLKVQMTDPGRLDGTIWFLDDASVEQ